MKNEPCDAHELAADSRIRLMGDLKEAILSGHWNGPMAVQAAQKTYDAILLTIYPEDGLSLRTHARKEQR